MRNGVRISTLVVWFCCLLGGINGNRPLTCDWWMRWLCALLLSADTTLVLTFVFRCAVVRVCSVRLFFLLGRLSNTRAEGSVQRARIAKHNNSIGRVHTKRGWRHDHRVGLLERRSSFEFSGLLFVVVRLGCVRCRVCVVSI